MTPDLVLFYVLSGMVIGSAILVVTGRNMVRSIFMFFVTLFAIAGLFILSLADFVALTQVVVYAGGVLVLMLFAFMLSDKDSLNHTLVLESGGLNINKIAAFVLAGLFFVVLVHTFTDAHSAGITWLLSSKKFLPTDGTAPHIGIALMTRYLVPFELVSVFLLMALIGAVHLSRKEQQA